MLNKNTGMRVCQQNVENVKKLNIKKTLSTKIINKIKTENSHPYNVIKKSGQDFTDPCLILSRRPIA